MTDEVGQATCRFWHNNILAFEINDVTPLVRADGWVDHFKVFRYWNGARDDTVRPRCSTLLPNEPNKILIDNFQATDQTAKPNNLDADGNRFIGGSF